MHFDAKFSLVLRCIGSIGRAATPLPPAPLPLHPPLTLRVEAIRSTYINAATAGYLVDKVMGAHPHKGHKRGADLPKLGQAFEPVGG